MKSPKNYEVFKLFKENQKLTVTWDKSFNHFGQTIYYIGVTEGLGGYRKMLQEGWKDKRDFKKINNKRYDWITPNKQKFLYLKQKQNESGN